jgi:hypothetical protein
MKENARYCLQSYVFTVPLTSCAWSTTDGSILYANDDTFDGKVVLPDKFFVLNG